ncbi:hypothetical protein [Paraburkholderia phenazinium]|jgi:hypothetical protein|uniref:Uncharacterized protein n=1 Tax=Paraburkholderia phenazinium TaxID=60549 RepID=A0A1G7X4F8_9BURK|nr:hypothetical protein [Paraburkholderia phenazinium]SDG79042.1 hypothetical protein SAMN05216466_105190 [Paraburkholderia phenazinium]
MAQRIYRVAERVYCAVGCAMYAGIASEKIALEHGTPEQLRAFFDSFERPAQRMPALASR